MQETLQTLQQQADESLTGAVSVQDYLAAVRAYSQQVTFLEDRIAGLGAFPALKEDAASELSGTIQMDSLKEHYQQQLKTMAEKADKLEFRLNLPSGVVQVQVGVDTEELRGMQLFSAEQINEMKRQVLTKKTMRTRERNTIDQSINAFTRDALQTFITTFGTSERYRSSSDSLGRYNAAIALKEAFWARAYIRATYGIKIGTIPVNYARQIFNADYLLSNVTIGPVTVWDENHLVTALNLATEASATLHNKDAYWIIEALRNLSTMFTGATASEEAKRIVIDMVRMDIEQELALGKSGGLKKVRAAYRDLYYTSDDQKAKVKERENLVFGDENDDGLEVDVNVVEAGTLKGVISQCINVLEQMEVRLDEARRLQASLVMLAADNAVASRRKKRASL